MAVREAETTVYNFPMAKLGVNLYSNMVDLHPEECFIAQNCVYRNGIVKRNGSAKVSDNEVSAGKRIVGLHRFYYGTASKQLIVASGTAIKYLNGSNWTTIDNTRTDSLETHFATWLGKCYTANGTDAPFSWDGSALAVLAGANVPTQPIMFLPYQDRMLFIETNQPGYLRWSGSFSDSSWETLSNCGVRPDSMLYGMCYHSDTSQSAGYQSKVLLAGANGMYLFYGTDLRVPSTTGNYTIMPLGTKVGCNAPRTMCWTPKGTIYLGNDRQVYILPFESSIPIPIGFKITSYNYPYAVKGIENIPIGRLDDATAVYHNGFYILSITPQGQSFNSEQWWLDTSRLYKDENGLWGPWYGPMIGNTTSCMTVQSGNGDGGELIGGEDNASTGSYVYELNKSGTYADNGTAMQIYYQTFYNPLGTIFLAKDIHRLESELLDVLGTVNVDFYDISGVLREGVSFGLSNEAIYWDDNYWDEKDFSSSMPTRRVINLSPAIQARFLSLLVKHSTSTDTFCLYSLRAEIKEQSYIFA